MVKKPAKYRNVRVRIDGITFDSLREAARYGELKLLQGAGLIRDLEVHPVYALQVLELTEATAPPWVIHTVGTYAADFRYHVVCDRTGHHRGCEDPTHENRFVSVEEEARRSAIRHSYYRN